MCGIFGFVTNSESGLDLTSCRRILIDLFHRSEPRGRDACGLVLVSGKTAQVYKKPLPPDKFLSDSGFKDFFAQKVGLSCDGSTGKINAPLAAIGHCRLVLSGTEFVHENNQPIIVGPIVGVHNGLVTNENELRKTFTQFNKTYDIDSEIIFQLIDDYRKNGYSLTNSISKSFDNIEGTASIAFFRQGEGYLHLATNYGSLFVSQGEGITVFASEKAILQNFLKANKNIIKNCNLIDRVNPDSGRLISLDTAKSKKIEFIDGKEKEERENETFEKIIDLTDCSENKIPLKRCISCILPATYPFIDFDNNGICNYCREYVAPKLFGESALEAELEKHRSHDGSPDCLVGLSGGRDSSYGLHLLKKKYHMHPVAFSYDWGMVTDISRRNQARICSQLKIEHIFRAANIPVKRRNMRNNIEAWLRRPHLGMVPLFMAGDKFFFSVARQLRSETGIPLVIHCGGNDLERTDFKAGFAGVREGSHGNRFYAFPLYHKLKIGLFYLSQYLLNPSYINESFFESVMSFFTTFVARDDFMYLYQYIPWNEEELVNTLLNKYAWEKAQYTENTWRIGDGYTTFINYIFYNVAGFSEFDTFRSQQIRAGLIDRDTALKLAHKDNQYDMATLKEFMGQVGLNLEEVLTRIGEIPKLS
jgi:glucosamine--fructose-6-phosphate aminotransferase (isomerizing)